MISLLRRLGWISLAAMSLALPALGQTTGDVEITVTPGRVDTTLGQSFDIEVTASNTGDAPSSPLVTHIDITDPTETTSVDPEDWTSELSQEIGVIPPGGMRSVAWSLQPISPGTFSLYAVAISAGSAEVSASAATVIEVAAARTLNPEGVLPVVLTGPVVVGTLLALVIRRSRRSSTGTATAPVDAGT